jgi:hypothetical protein
MGIFITTCYTVLIVMSNFEVETQSNLLPIGLDIAGMSAEEISNRRHGSKIVIVVEQMQIAVVWGCKSCLLILYHRLTDSVAAKSNIAIRVLAVYVALGFVIMEILYFAAWCRPFSGYWAVPALSSQCNALINHRITNAVFNISSDLIMLSIALSLFIRSLLPWKRKLVLCGIFSFGIFAIVAAALNKYYSFTRPYEPTWIFWYCRESSTAILVANLPFTWTLLRKLSNVGAFDEEHPPPPTYHSSRTAGGRRTARAHYRHSNSEGNEKPSHSTGHGSGVSHPGSFLGSTGAAKDEAGYLNTKSTRSDPDPIDKAVQFHDFATKSSDSDIEKGLPASSIARPRTTSAPAASRSSSPSPTSVRTKTIFPDGTGGYIRSPHRAYLAPLNGYGASRPPSSTSSVYRPASPTSTQNSATTSLRDEIIPGVHLGHASEGGRSATDRRKRARMSP